MASHTEEGTSSGGAEAGPLSIVLAGAASGVVLAAYLLPTFAADNEAVRNFSLVFSSIMLEAMPFMLLGTLVGGLIEVFVSRERMESLLPRSRWASACIAAALGIVFPVCECAIVPVVRRLAGKGLPAAAAVAYLLAGPIVNPVVGLSTAMAYNFDWRPVAVRLGFGYVIAVGVALLLTRVFPRDSLFTAGVVAADHHHAHDHDHEHHGCCSCGCGHKRHGVGGRLAQACDHALDDFMATAPYLVVGAALAAIAQTCLERRLFLEMASSSLLSAGAMSLLAVLLNLCSEADAFIAASFRGLVPFSAQMAFLVIGPMFDIKLLLMYRNLFTIKVVPLLALLIVAAVMIMSVLLEAMGVAS